MYNKLYLSRWQVFIYSELISGYSYAIMEKMYTLVIKRKSNVLSFSSLEPGQNSSGYPNTRSTGVDNSLRS